MKRRRFWILAAVLLSAALIAVLGVKGYTDTHVRAAGEWISREATQADLRGNPLSVEEFQELRQVLPNCEILWDVPFQGKLIPSDTETLEVTELTEEDLEILEYFSHLKVLDASQCDDYEALMAYHEAHADCRVHYHVELGGNSWEEDATLVTLKDADGQELLKKLRVLPDVTRVELTGTLPTLEEMELLRSTYPQVTFAYDLWFQGRNISGDAAFLDLSGKFLSDGEAEKLLAWLPDVQRVDLRGSSLSSGQIMALADAFPQAFFLWDVTIGEVVVSTDAEEIDISGQILKSTREIEDLLPYFPNLKKVVMSRCGFDDETMDALNKRYEDIRFVWSIKIQSHYIRTDVDFFFPWTLSHSMRVSSEDLYPLRYCTDIVAIDVGHSRGVRDCEWAAYMPNLTYLILADTGVTDLSPLSGLKNLAYLEIFSTNVKDYSPLVTCTSLVDLNLSRTYGHWGPIAQMPWLEHLWWNGLQQKSNSNYDPALVNTEAELTPYLPNTETMFGTGSAVVQNGWRQLENHIRMRDIMGVFYLEEPLSKPE